MQANELQSAQLLTPSQANVLRDLLRGRTMTEAARNADIHRSTIHRWMQQDNFRLTLENAQRESYLAAFLEVHTLMRPATERLLEAIHSPKTSSATLLKIHQWLHALYAKGQPSMQTSARENLAILNNLLDPNTPELDLPATQCDTQHAFPQTSQLRTDGTQCDMATSILQTSHAETAATTISQTPEPVTEQPAQQTAPHTLNPMSVVSTAPAQHLKAPTRPHLDETRLRSRKQIAYWEHRFGYPLTSVAA
jgi:hypothetical protein